jgi:hypothetical protein
LPGIEDAFMIGAVHSDTTSGIGLARPFAGGLLGRASDLPLAAFDPARLATAAPAAA